MLFSKEDKKKTFLWSPPKKSPNFSLWQGRPLWITDCILTRTWLPFPFITWTSLLLDLMLVFLQDKRVENSHIITAVLLTPLCSWYPKDCWDHLTYNLCVCIQLQQTISVVFQSLVISSNFRLLTISSSQNFVHFTTDTLTLSILVSSII